MIKQGVRSVEDMEVFKKAHKVTLTIYEITKKFPEDEKFSLVSQMRRAAYSITSNLMEGGYRLNRKEYRQFVGIARGSAGELKYFLLLSKDLNYITEANYMLLKNSIEEISKMLGGLIRSLSNTDTKH